MYFNSMIIHYYYSFSLTTARVFTLAFFLRLRRLFPLKFRKKNITENWFFCIINRSDIIIIRVRESRQKNICGIWFCRLDVDDNNIVIVSDEAHMSWRLLRTNTK